MASGKVDQLYLSARIIKVVAHFDLQGKIAVKMRLVVSIPAYVLKLVPLQTQVELTGLTAEMSMKLTSNLVLWKSVPFCHQSVLQESH